MKRKYHRKDTSQMDAKQLKQYKKLLANVRSYYRDKKEWQKRIIAKSTPYKTLKEYRAAKYGDFRAAQITKEFNNFDNIKSKEVSYVNVESIEKLERLLNNLKKAKTEEIALLIELRSLL